MKEYDFALAQYFGAGIIACYRGDKIFDSPETKLIVKKWVKFYKVNRFIIKTMFQHHFIKKLFYKIIIELQKYFKWRYNTYSKSRYAKYRWIYAC